MRVFSEINNQPARSNLHTVPPTQPLVIIPERGQSGQSAQQSNSRSYQSFRLQPTQFFQANRTKTPPINYSDHIRVDSDSEQAKEAGIEPPNDVRPRRKKIFDRRNQVQTLKEGPVLQLLNETKPSASPQNDQSHRINNLTSKLREAERYSPPSEMLKPPVQIQQEETAKLYSKNESISHINQSSYINDSKERIIKRYRQEDRTYEQERLRNLLNSPILMESSRIEPTKSSRIDPQLQFILKNYPKVVQRLEKNEYDIASLQHQLNIKIEEDKVKQRMKIIEFNKRLAEGDSNVNKSYTRQRNKMEDQERKEQLRQGQQHKIELEIEQSKRLELLIQQNRHLCAKVMQQRSRNNKSQNKDQYETIEQRIQQLRSMRTSYLNPESKSPKTISSKAGNLVNLDISVIQPKLISSPISNPRINIAPPKVIRSTPPPVFNNQKNMNAMNSSIRTVKIQDGYEIYGKNY